MRIIETSVYTFAELSETAQAAAIEHIRENMAGAWWDTFDTDAIGEAILMTLADKFGEPGAARYGVSDYPGIPDVKITAWDTDRGGSLAVDGQLTRDNAPRLPWAPGIRAVALTGRHSDHTLVYVERTDAEEDGVPPATDSECDVMTEAVRDAMCAALKTGNDELEYRTSDEYAREWAELHDDQEYNADGTLY